MVLPRVGWEDLSDATRKAVVAYTGRVRSARTVSEGMNSSVALLLKTTGSGSVFVKGLRRDYQRRWTQDREWDINPYLASKVAPRALWRIQNDEWDLIGFQAVEGRHAVYKPGSPDLPRLLYTMTTLGQVFAPLGVKIKTARDRWEPYVDQPEHLVWFDGDNLLHTDYNPLNVIISGSRAVLIDWAWATKGPGWIDPACLVLRLIAGGHKPDQAENVVSGLREWRYAPREALDAFALASVRLWREIHENAGEPWTAQMEEAATEWRNYRLGVS